MKAAVIAAACMAGIFSCVLLYAQGAAPSATLVPISPPVPAATPAPSPAAIGRYQIVAGSSSSDRVWLVDTATGDTWYRGTGSNTWRRGGNPVKDPGVAPPPAPILPER